jgi:ubiquinone/menaquinone biosynthesis C-methylase UbiE
MSTQQHWEEVYATKQENERSWFQSYPSTSMSFFVDLNLSKDMNIIDVGGGDSHFVDALLDLGYTNVWVLDLSSHAIERARERLGDRAASVHWVVGDILDFSPPTTFGFWHDRAAFHFLTSPEQIDTYIALAERSIAPNGYMVIGTFSEEGPTKCSGLEIKQYSATSIKERFAHGFDRYTCIENVHTTPFETTQNFVFCRFQRKA